MKKIFVIAMASLLLSSCALYKCKFISTGTYKGSFRACLECDTTNTVIQKRALKK